jgi:hypothetical protein
VEIIVSGLERDDTPEPVVRLPQAQLLGAACLVVVALGFAGVATDSAAASADEAIVAKLLAPVSAVARLVEDEKWKPVLDEIVQNAPAAASLGSRWTPQSAGWQKARSALGARYMRSVDAYAKSDAMPRTLQAALADTISTDEAPVYEKALNGPAGRTIIHYQALSAFVAIVMSSSPREPQYGQPGWTERMTALRKIFDERAGAAVPREDPAQKADAGRFIGDPIGRKATQAWMSAAGKAALKIDGVINLMLFDEQNAIQRELADAAATAK